MFRLRPFKETDYKHPQLDACNSQLISESGLRFLDSDNCEVLKGINDFRKIALGDFIYVDKTKYIYMK